MRVRPYLQGNSGQGNLYKSSAILVARIAAAPLLNDFASGYLI